jgi:hypothetical protein
MKNFLSKHPIFLTETSTSKCGSIYLGRFGRDPSGSEKRRTIMESNGEMELGNLPSLQDQLCKLELAYVDVQDGRDVDARQDVLDALANYGKSRFRLGEALATYKTFYSEGRGWMEAAKAIGQAMGRDERTVRRMIEDFQRASQCHPAVIVELESLGLDPAAKKNEPLLATILEMPSTYVAAEPKAAAAKAVEEVNTAKKLKRSKKPSQSVPVTDDSSSEPLTKAEKQRFAIRLKLRTALTNVPSGRKLAELIAALEEEMFEIWGERNTIEITLTPRSSTLTVDGRGKQEQAA